MLIGKIWKPFAFVFLIFFLAINWEDISWMFNYRVIASLIEDRVEAFQPVAASFEYSDKEDSVEISKLEVSAPLIDKSDELDRKILQKALEGGAIIFSNSAAPGSFGQTVILGHSAPIGWPKVKYFWIFSRLSELEEGDEVILNFNKRKFTYRVKEKHYIDKGEEVPHYNPADRKNVLILISCWPPGKDIRRIAVAAELKQ